MPLFPIDLPPGVFRSGTELQSSGRYYDTDQVRWQNGALQPTGGWAQISVGTVSGAARAIHIWADNSGQAQTVIGTHTGLFALDRAGNLYDITPAGLTPGRESADNQGGYGNGLHGRGLYGTARPFSLDIHDVTVWTLENYGEDLNCCNADDGVIYEWDRNIGHLATALSGAPTARAIVATAERILMALGANGNPRAIQWSDQEDNTDWTPATTNYAGDWVLQTSGKIMCGRRVPSGVLIVTSSDCWLASFLGQPLVYGFTQVGGAGTGIVAQGAIATIDGEAVPVSAVWMAPQGFMGENGGAVQPLPCDVAGEVFSNINRNQISKVTAFHNADFGEVKWYYPSAESNENDRYVVWNYREDWWALGHTGIRTCGSERGPLANPLTVDIDGAVYKEEYGLDHGGNQPYAETGDFIIGQGDKVIQVNKIIPDEKTSGDLEATFYTKFQPNGDETARGPYALKAETNVRWTARMFRVRVTGTRLASWRWGKPKLNGVPMGLR